MPLDSAISTQLACSPTSVRSTSTVSANTALSATIAVANGLQFTPGLLQLFSGAPFSGALLDSAPLTFSGSAYTASFSDPLDPGIYYAEITGRVNSKILGVGGSVTTVAVPEPVTWVMMALGFVGLGFAGYRSSRRSVDFDS